MFAFLFRTIGRLWCSGRPNSSVCCNFSFEAIVDLRRNCRLRSNIDKCFASENLSLIVGLQIFAWIAGQFGGERIHWDRVAIDAQRTEASVGKTEHQHSAIFDWDTTQISADRRRRISEFFVEIERNIVAGRVQAHRSIDMGTGIGYGGSDTLGARIIRQILGHR